MDIREPLRSRLKKNYIWRFAEPPIYSRASIPGFKNVSVKLEGNYDFGPQTSSIPIPPDPPEPGPNSPVVVEPDGRRKVQLNWRTVEGSWLNYFFGNGNSMLYWYGDLYNDFNPTTETWYWLSDDKRNPSTIIRTEPLYSGWLLFRGGPKHFQYSAEGVTPDFPLPVLPPSGL